ncbi:ROK family protein [Arthrobacter sp. MW3 TE3886]|uniref:ROK family protein n=1 Tax=Arthrobacter sp. MW3 TE3886 TaxID=3156254 RepID=UPI003515141B
MLLADEYFHLAARLWARGAGAGAGAGSGSGVRPGNLIYLNGGASGIGGGIIADGHLLRGASGYAGELGHTFVRSGGTTCHCGATGCLETEVSQSRLLELAGLSSGDTADLEKALGSSNSAGLSDEVARQLTYLGIALRNAVNIFNPDAIVLDGFLGTLHTLAPEALHAMLQSQAMDGPAGQAKIHRAALGSDLMMIGAAELAFTPFLANPASLGKAATDYVRADIRPFVNGLLERIPNGTSTWRDKAPEVSATDFRSSHPSEDSVEFGLDCRLNPVMGLAVAHELANAGPTGKVAIISVDGLPKDFRA